MSDASDFFSTTEVSARLDLVRHLIENSELVPLLRGPSGIGKTLMASRLQQLAPDNWAVCRFEADPTMQPERLLATIARCAGLPDIAGELLQRLVDRFEVLRKRGRIPVLLVDDAQMLPPTSLITLLRLFERQLNGVRLVSIVLFADEQIDLLLSTPQLQVMSPQAIQVIDLPVMTRQEAVAYMKFLLINEGLSENLAIDEVRLNRIFRETNGIPGPLAAGILNAVGEEGVEGSTDSFFSGYKKQLLIGGVPLLLVVSMFMWLISSMIEPEPEVMPDKQVEKQIEPLPAPIVFPQPEATIADAPMPEAVQRETPPQALSEEVGDLDPEEITQTPDDPVSVETEVSSESPDESAGISPVQTEPHTVEETKVSAAATQGVDEGRSVASRDGIDGEVGSPSVIEEASTVAGVEEAPTVVAEEEASPAVEAGESARVAEPPEQVVGTRDDPEPPESPKPAKPLIEQGGGDSAANWVMTRSPGHYTLQLIAVENLDSLKRYISSNGLRGETHTFRMMRRGKPWYALLWGDFPDRASAQKAVSRLPLKVQKAGVWARTFASLQQSQRQ